MRALLVGLVHGMAGSAALILLTLERTKSVTAGIFYMLFFGAGSIVGMALLSVVIAVPFRLSASSLTKLRSGLQWAVGIATLALGLSTVYASVLGP